MTIRQQGGRWPAVIAPLGATVQKVNVAPSNGYLHVDLWHPETNRGIPITIPTPWTFSSCLLSIYSENLSEPVSTSIATDDLIGLEGASLTRIERGPKHIDLVFGSIRLSLSNDLA